MESTGSSSGMSSNGYQYSSGNYYRRSSDDQTGQRNSRALSSDPSRTPGQQSMRYVPDNVSLTVNGYNSSSFTGGKHACMHAQKIVFSF